MSTREKRFAIAFHFYVNGLRTSPKLKYMCRYETKSLDVQRNLSITSEPFDFCSGFDNISGP